MRLAPFACALIFALAGCAARAPLVMVSPFPPISSVAVLPFDNETVDVDGPPLVRKEVSAALGRRGYLVKTDAEVDGLLKTEFGITDGGQLRSTQPKLLAEKLGVDGVVYGSVLQFGYQNFGFYRNRRVAARLRLVEASSGTVVWEDERQIQKPDVALSKDEAKKKLLLGILERQVEKTFGTPLIPETQALAVLILRSLPKAP